ncbi:MAG: PqqD family protein [Geminicoccaceae bacterium]
MTDETLVTNDAQVASKVIDGEAILIHLGTSVYYSLDGVGAALWQAFARGATTAEAVALAAEACAIPPSTARESVTTLVEQLRAEDLLVAAPPRAVPAPDNAPGSLVWSPPVLGRYDDMMAHLALDPPLPTFDRSGTA